MSQIIKSVRGTQDVLPGQSARWRALEQVASRVASSFGFQEIRFPTFEYTALFQRSVGETTDVVQKEMYTFEDKGGRSITLRPEGTAGTLRAVLENNLLDAPLPLKLYYHTSCFRHEKPQLGRLREFHQFGIEMLGAPGPRCDAEVIAVAHSIFEMLGLRNLSLEINSLGCPECRPAFQQSLKSYFESHKNEFCETCLGRLERNPMRILDCKNPQCAKVAQGAPVGLDTICEPCREHFDGLKDGLAQMEIPFTINARIVRGLDYYSRTVFEFVSNEIGAQGTVCGGGRYDGLIELLGGKKTPALGFAMGMERLLLLLGAQGIELPGERECEIYIASVGEAAAREAFALAMRLRAEGFWAEYDSMGRSLKAQMRFADKLGAQMSMVLGEDELAAKTAQLKDMRTGETRSIRYETQLVEALYETGLSAALCGDDTLEDLLGRLSAQEISE